MTATRIVHDMSQGGKPVEVTLTAAEEQGLQAERAARTMPSPSIAPLAFMDRFGDDEMAAIETAAESNVQLRIWLRRLGTAQEIDLGNQRTRDGVQALVDAGLITAERRDDILAP